MKKVFLVLFMLTAIQAMALNKQDFDIREGLQKSSQAQQTNFYGSSMLRSSEMEMSLISGGYFTIGTNAGHPDTEFDDHSTITFGHPYAMTSYPYINIDGVWGRFDELHGNLADLVPVQNHDSLVVSFTTVDQLLVSFAMNFDVDGQGILLSLSLINNDDQVHELGGGLVIDPALSRYGDGVVFNGAMAMNEPVNGITDSMLEIWERNAEPKGMMTRLLLEEQPSTINVGNWDRIYETPFAEILDKYLYDTALQLLWNAREIQPGDTLNCNVQMQYLEPDFSGDLFLRWDMPTEFILSNNVLFPHSIKTTVEAFTNNQYFVAPEITLLLDNPYEIYGNGEMYDWTLTGNQSFRSMDLTTREIYEEKIVKIRLIAMYDQTFQDSLVRYVKIPATPVTNEGLIVHIDSLITGSYPDMQVVMSGEIEESGQKLLDLHKENIFLFENEQRIELFDLDKFSGGGTSLADVVFVLDVSGSMGDEIAAVRNNLGEFADSLVARGFDFRIGVVTFSTTIDLVLDLTDDVNYIKEQLAAISLWGGIEDSPSALVKASELSLREGSKRNIIWVTDEAYPEDQYTVEEVVNRMLLNNITVHGVGLTSLQTDWFNPIVVPTGGNFFDINGNFRDILLEVSRIKTQDRYALSYKSQATGNAPIGLRIEVHYAGLGGQADTTFTPGALLNAPGEDLACFPNPFNPEITLKMQLNAHEQGMVDIYNVLGQRVRHFDLARQVQPQIVWNATNDQGIPVSAGTYIVQFTRLAQDGSRNSEIRKILYLK